MKVRATKTGHYGILREPDGPHAVFDLKDEKHFSATWMERVDDGSDDSPEDDAKPLAKRPIAELREMAESRGLDHNDVEKKDLAALIESHDADPGAFA